MRLTLFLTVVICFSALTISARAQSTTQNFDGGGTAFTLSNFGGPPATIVPAGNPGNAVQLTYASAGSTVNTIAFDRTAVGPFTQVTANFDFFIGNGSHADGFSFALLDTGTFGTTGASPGFGEEPNLTKSFGAEFDTFNNGEVSNNYVALHFNGSSDLAVQDLYPLSFILSNAAWNHAQITITPVAGGSDVTMTLSPSTGSGNPTVTPFSDVFIAGLNPYESRVAFGARTGGATEDMLLDNINVSFSTIPEPSTLVEMTLAAACLLGYAGLRRLKGA
jgi:hypothetical protein